MEIVGYVFDGEFQCVHCCAGIDTEECEPVFAHDLWDSYPVCVICGDKCREVNLSESGQEEEELLNEMD